MKKLFGLMVVGACLLAPTMAQAQTGVISGTATAGAGGATTVCVNADANVKGMAGLSLEFHLPAGVTVVGTGDAAFKGGAFATGALAAVNTNDAAVVKVAIVGSAGKDGPIAVGCIDVTAPANFSGVITLVAEPNDQDSNPIAVTVTPIQIGTPTVTCPAGQHAENGVCVNDTPVTCPAGQHLENGACVADPPVGNCPTDAAGDTDITAVTGAAGQSVNLVITTTKTGVAGAELTIKFDPKVLQFTGADADIKAGSLFSGALVAANTNNKATGEIKLAIVASAGTTAAGQLAVIPITIAANAGPNGGAAVNLEATLNDVNSDVIAGTVGNGVVTIGTGCGTPVTCPTGQHLENGVCVVDPPTCPAGQHLENGACVPDSTTPPANGDVTGDGSINVADVREAIRVLFGLNNGGPATASADFDDDGDVDLVDIRRLLQRVVNGG